eukprot:1361723-Lingulodinium_polyedra.AAC.1
MHVLVWADVSSLRFTRGAAHPRMWTRGHERSTSSNVAWLTTCLSEATRKRQLRRAEATEEGGAAKRQATGRAAGG